MSFNSMQNSDFSKPIIEVINATKYYKIFRDPRDRLKQFVWRGKRNYSTNSWALHDISFTVKKGDSVAIVGENGSGKSTLLQIICSTVSPSSGSVAVNGRIGALLELGSGFNPEFTGLENVYLNAALLGIERIQIQRILSEIHDFSEIGEYLYQPVKTYSSGMLLRLAFSVIAFSDPEILIVDEALAVGDIFFQQKCLRRIRYLQENGLTLLLVSHDETTVRTFCSTGIYLDKGKPVFIGAIKECMDLYLNKSRSGSAHFFSQRLEPLRIDNTLTASSMVYGEQLRAKSNCRVAAEKRFTADLGDKTVEIIDFFYQNNISSSDYVENFSLGEQVTFTIVLKAKGPVPEPAIGYMVKDKNGMYIFSIESDEYYHSLKSLPSFQEGFNYAIQMTFLIPPMRSGVYTVDLAVANGKGSAHHQCTWIYESHVLYVETTTLCNGVVGSPWLNVTAKRVDI